MHLFAKARSGLAPNKLFVAAGIVAFALLVLPRPVHADLVELTARPNTGDTVSWGVPLQNQFSSPLSFTSTGGTSGTANFSGLGGLFEQCCVGANGNYNGDFAPGDTVLAIGTNGLSIDFNTPVQIVGTQIQDNRIGDHFTAEILAFNGSVLLGTFTENGFTGSAGDNSAISLGAEDASADKLAAASTINSLSQRRPRAIEATSVARV